MSIHLIEFVLLQISLLQLYIKSIRETIVLHYVHRGGTPLRPVTVRNHELTYRVIEESVLEIGSSCDVRACHIRHTSIHDKDID